MAHTCVCFSTIGIGFSTWISQIDTMLQIRFWNPPVHTEYSCVCNLLSIFFAAIRHLFRTLSFTISHSNHCTFTTIVLIHLLALYHIIRKIYVILSLVFNIGKQNFIFSLFLPLGHPFFKNQCVRTYVEICGPFQSLGEGISISKCQFVDELNLFLLWNADSKFMLPERL